MTTSVVGADAPKVASRPFRGRETAHPPSQTPAGPALPRLSYRPQPVPRARVPWPPPLPRPSSPASTSTTSTRCSPRRSAPCATPSAPGWTTPHAGHRRRATSKGKFPKQLIPGMAELGLFGANLPEEYGCAGLNNVAYGLIMQELERGDSGIRSFASVQGALVMYPIYAFGSEEQKKHWLPQLAIGQGDRLLRADRARLRLQPRRDDHHREGDDGRLGAERHQDVDHQRLAGHRRDHLGQDRRHRRRQVDPRLHRPDRHQGLHRQGPEGEALAPRQRHQRAASARTCTLPKDAILPKSRRAQEPAHVPDPGALRHRVGRGRARRWRATTRRCSYAKSRVMFGKPIGADPAPAGAAGRDAHRDHQGAAAAPAARPAQGRGHHDARSRCRSPSGTT